MSTIFLAFEWQSESTISLIKDYMHKMTHTLNVSAPVKRYISKAQREIINANEGSKLFLYRWIVKYTPHTGSCFLKRKVDNEEIQLFFSLFEVLGHAI